MEKCGEHDTSEEGGSRFPCYAVQAPNESGFGVIPFGFSNLPTTWAIEALVLGLRNPSPQKPSTILFHYPLSLTPFLHPPSTARMLRSFARTRHIPCLPPRSSAGVAAAPVSSPAAMMMLPVDGRQQHLQQQQQQYQQQQRRAMTSQHNAGQSLTCPLHPVHWKGHNYKPLLIKKRGVDIVQVRKGRREGGRDGRRECSSSLSSFSACVCVCWGLAREGARRLARVRGGRMAGREGGREAGRA